MTQREREIKEFELWQEAMGGPVRPLTQSKYTFPKPAGWDNESSMIGKKNLYEFKPPVIIPAKIPSRVPRTEKENLLDCAAAAIVKLDREDASATLVKSNDDLMVVVVRGKEAVAEIEKLVNIQMDAWDLRG